MGLSDLPEELVSNIADRLISDDLFALRSCSRALRDKALHNFTTEYFSSKCVHLTSDSLKALVTISKSKFARHVKEVSVSTGWFSEVAFSCPGRAAEHYRPSLRQGEAYKFLISDQKQIKENGNDRALLAEAFKGLSGLKTVSLVDSISLLASHTDYRGEHKTRRQTGTDPMDGMSPEDRVRSPEYRKHVNHVWTTIMHALADAHEYVSLDALRPATVATPNSISARALEMRPKNVKRLSTVLTGATSMSLQMKSIPGQEKHHEAIGRYAALFPKATNFFLSFDLEPESGYLCRTLMKKVNTDIITHFALNGLCIEASPLAKIFAGMKKVVDLKLDWIDLTTGSWPEVLEVIGKLEHVDHLHLMYLREAGRKAFFRTLKEVDHDGMPPGFDDPWEDEDEDGSDSELDTDDDLPDLEPVDDLVRADANAASDAAVGPAETIEDDASLGATTATSETTEDERDVLDEIPDYVPGGALGEYGGERGFYVCVSGHERIMRELKVFIKEYNTGESLEDEAANDFFGGVLPIPIAVGGGGHGANGANGIPPAPQNVINNIMQAAFGHAQPPFPGFAAHAVPVPNAPHAPAAPPPAAGAPPAAAANGQGPPQPAPPQAPANTATQAAPAWFAGDIGSDEEQGDGDDEEGAEFSDDGLGGVGLD